MNCCNRKEEYYGRIPGYIMLYILALIPPIISLLYATEQNWYKNLKKDGWYPFLFTCMYYVSCVFLFVSAIMLPNFEILFIYGLMTIFLYTLAYFVLFQGYDAAIALWLFAIITLIYMFLMYYISKINVIVSLFIIPSIIASIYIFYSIYHLLDINNIPI